MMLSMSAEPTRTEEQAHEGLSLDFRKSTAEILHKIMIPE